MANSPQTTKCDKHPRYDLIPFCPDCRYEREELNRQLYDARAEIRKLTIISVVSGLSVIFQSALWLFK